MYCKLPWTALDVDPNGDIFPCCRAHYTNLGNIFHGDVWNGEPIQELRRQLWKGEVDPVRFKDCYHCSYKGKGQKDGQGI